MKLNRISGILMPAALLSGVWLTAADRHSPIGYSDTPVLPGQKWKVHDIDRPRPRMVTPGVKPGDPPSDAIVLFNGKDLSHWMSRKKGVLSAPGWTLGKGYVECTGKGGDLVSKEKFGDAQFHIEWAAPVKIEGTSQWRGNSGILLMERYEIQVLDSWDNPSYADGQAGSIYGQWPPLVNPVRRPGEWQSYDIAFEAPKFNGDQVVKRANVTVFLNGILLHNRKEIIGAMAHRQVGVYKAHAGEESLGLQDHDTPVRYRNIWVRRLTGYDQSEAK
ncbi:MAG: DUF1080 domain-containing protein, partial [Acidobacteria bacterium]|nr:DUF1080 domain-containing protein [Acidobacteriota bacterium]